MTAAQLAFKKAPARLKITLAYDGTAFAGWQSQTHGNTIQDRLEKAIQRVVGKVVRVHGAGRTDAGVHALGQCAHVDLPDRTRSPNEWQRTLNGLLPAQIRVMRARYVSTNFHARFSAKTKTYRYRIWTGPILPPLEVDRAWHITAPLDFRKLRDAASIFEGKHDFVAFAANRGKPNTSTVRIIHRIRTTRSGPAIAIEFEGDGFLYKMVRLMVGSIVECASGKISVQTIVDRVSSPFEVGTARSVAPAAGLILVRIRY
jgi:tRNA pseudouridine38-40 synthase